ncbi:MAG: sigma-70 family RNA polymerase sigma factor [Hyphomicrobiaceae bacterium]|nr:sigma-70 family RNA polymerase sigma factor [Hyphomicrobiaceae bacterium]
MSHPDQRASIQLFGHDVNGLRHQLVALLTAKANGNRGAFAKLHHIMHARLLAVSRKIICEQAVAEEVLQEVFLTIWQKAHLYSETSGSPIAWMNSLARNKAIDYLRRHRRRYEVERKGHIEDLSGSNSDMAEARIVDKQSILRCLQELRYEHRWLILLAYYKGLTNPELSRVTNMPLGTVKSRLRRALAQLEACLER